MLEHDEKLWTEFWSIMIEEYKVEEYSEAFRTAFEKASKNVAVLVPTIVKPVTTLHEPVKPRKKRGKSGYHVYFGYRSKDDDMRKISHPQRMKAIGVEWRAMSENDKLKYTDEAKTEKQNKSDKLKSIDTDKCKEAVDEDLPVISKPKKIKEKKQKIKPKNKTIKKKTDDVVVQEQEELELKTEEQNDFESDDETEQFITTTQFDENDILSNSDNEGDVLMSDSDSDSD